MRILDHLGPQRSLLHTWPADEEVKKATAPVPSPALWTAAAEALPRRLALRADGLFLDDPLNSHGTESYQLDGVLAGRGRGWEATFADAAEAMADHRVHHLLVRDGDRLAGMVHLDVEWSQLSGAAGPPVASFAAPI